MKHYHLPFLLILLIFLGQGCASSAATTEGSAVGEQTILLGATLDVLSKSVSELSDDTRTLGEGTYTYSETGLNSTAVTLSFLTGTSGESTVQLNEGVVSLQDYPLAGSEVLASGTIRFSSEITFQPGRILPLSAEAEAQIDLSYTSGLSTVVGNLRIDLIEITLGGSLVVDGSSRGDLNIAFSSFPAPGPRDDPPEDQQELVKLVLGDIENALEVLLEASFMEDTLSVEQDSIVATAGINFESNDQTTTLTLQDIQISLGQKEGNWGNTGLSGQISGRLELVMGTMDREVISSFYLLEAQNLQAQEDFQIILELTGDFYRGSVSGSVKIDDVEYDPEAFSYLVKNQ